MSGPPSDSFLPSGAMASPPTFSPNSLVSPASQVPRTVPDFPPQSHSSPSQNQKPYLHSSRSPSSQDRPISPPKTRSASADNNPAALVEDWRTYTNKLRMQNEGERAHMVADRTRMEEVMAEERALWEQERKYLNGRIVDLEAELELMKKSPGGSFLSLKERIHSQSQQNALSFASPGSNAISVSGSIDGSSSRFVPQESGRNADGSPFYAPAPRNPSRTFEVNEISALRVDTISAARETPIRVTSKELTPSDFGVQSPPTTATELETIPELLPESIDISHILPGGDGIQIKASAVLPEFVAKVLSPQTHSPAKLSPNIRPLVRDVGQTLSPHARDNLSPLSRDTDGKVVEKADVGTVISAPENKRLTMHAGHTPNHSISKLDFLTAESGSATPTQVHTESQPHVHRPTCSKFDGADDLDGDRELTGPLGLTNERGTDDIFFAKLVEKLAEVEKSEGVSPSSESTSSLRSDMEEKERESAHQEEEKDLPLLKLKPSLNFGRPMGSLH